MTCCLAGSLPPRCLGEPGLGPQAGEQSVERAAQMPGDLGTALRTGPQAARRAVIPYIRAASRDHGHRTVRRPPLPGT